MAPASIAFPYPSLLSGPSTKTMNRGFNVQLKHPDLFFYSEILSLLMQRKENPGNRKRALKLGFQKQGLRFAIEFASEHILSLFSI
jgi:hypothetical protein